ncbi:hypothetical protein ACQ4LE_000701 [Meloidogyne hapla]|uniref:Uncharacterized protein n=1 Tax=Meloidogyne hapla TaxID=6305 RepID=A0A1I8BCV3_MELHA
MEENEETEIEIKRKIEEVIHHLTVLGQRNLQREEEANEIEIENAKLLELQKKLKKIQQKNTQTKLFMLLGAIYGTITGSTIYAANCLYNQEIDFEGGGMIFGGTLIGTFIGGLISKYK